MHTAALCMPRPVRTFVAKGQRAGHSRRARVHMLHTQGLSRSREKAPRNLWITPWEYAETARKPTKSWAFVLFQRTPTALSTGLSGLFIGTYSTSAYAAYAGWRDASGPHAAPLRQRFGPGWRCIGQP